MQIDGIKGKVDAPAGGMNVCMGDGSVRFIRYSVSDARVATVNGNETRGRGGVLTTSGNFSSAVPNAIEIARISLPDSPSGFDSVDSHQADAAIKVRMLFDATRGAGAANGVVVSVSKAAKMRSSNNLKQIGLGMHWRIPALKLLVMDGGNSNVAAIELENVLVSSWQTSAVNGSDVPAESLSLNFTKIKY